MHPDSTNAAKGIPPPGEELPELKPCPHCDKLLVADSGPKGLTYWEHPPNAVRCVHQGIRIYKLVDAEAWNRRASGSKQHLQNIVALVLDQAEDDGLWFKATTCPEGYLQQELRRLHALIEQPQEPPEAETSEPEGEK